MESLASRKAPSLEVVALDALRCAREDATMARALPVLSWRNRSELNLPQLLGRAKENRVDRTLGFFLDLTTAITADDRFAKAARPLHLPAGVTDEYLFRGGGDE